MDDQNKLSRTETAIAVAVLLLIGVVIALFEGWMLDTALNQSVDQVFGRRRSGWVIPAIVVMAAALAGLAAAFFSLGRGMLAGDTKSSSTIAGVAAAGIYSAIVGIVLVSKYYRHWWTESLGVILVGIFVLYFVIAILYAVGRGLITGDWSHFK